MLLLGESGLCVRRERSRFETVKLMRTQNMDVAVTALIARCGMNAHWSAVHVENDARIGNYKSDRHLCQV
ncbi:hypothetical protein GN958_ATG18826 [Phytophthora infestans]|uniref:Uncharacterized protein n=1 Tax=Phytophthora infestans TaxID=4787 RepID=A0A8S9TVB4_PHYIN|nr:hypothetical protein GN958_ATG18826 [Phytophthora infestans]